LKKADAETVDKVEDAINKDRCDAKPESNSAIELKQLDVSARIEALKAKKKEHLEGFELLNEIEIAKDRAESGKKLRKVDLKVLIQSKGCVPPSYANLSTLGSEWENIKDDEDITLDEVFPWRPADELALETLLELQNLSTGNVD
jgi:hypothetical protein